MTEEESRLYEKAVRLAASAHKGQVDKGGTDYIRHPLAVASMLEDSRDRIAAVLHDVVEDTKVTLEELAREFPPDIVEAVRLLTRQPGPDFTYRGYLEEIRKNSMARRVKMADLAHNMDLGRISHPGPEDYARREKYRKSMIFLRQDKEKTMELQAIHHVAVIVSDYRKSRHFYVDLLGFEVIRENYREDRGDYKLDLRLGDCELEIFGIPDSPPRPSYPEACGLRHLAFRVENIEETIAWLNGLGIPTEPVRTDEFTGKKMTFFKDPDGLPLELHE